MCLIAVYFLLHEPISEKKTKSLRKELREEIIIRQSNCTVTKQEDLQLTTGTLLESKEQRPSNQVQTLKGVLGYE